MGQREFIQLLVREHADQPIMPNNFAHHGPILLLHMGIIVGAYRATPRKSEIFVLTIGEQESIEKLTSIIRVQAQQRKREKVDVPV